MSREVPSIQRHMYRILSREIVRESSVMMAVGGLSAEAKAATGGRGVDVILDMVAGDYIGRGVQALADDGRLALIAVQGGVKSDVDAGLVLRKRLTITGSTLRPRSIPYKTMLAKELRATVWPLIEAGRIKPVIHQVFPAAKAAEAHALMESSTHIGKIVLTWN